jgi:predicted DsbA family dithiol-disulfide isomerase
LIKINAARRRRGQTTISATLAAIMSVVDITYFSDVLCVWAYVSQVRIDAIKEKFAGTVRIKYRFCSVFGDTAQKISTTWKDKGGYEGFNAHLRQVAGKFPHITLHPQIWRQTRPLSSASPHLFLKAVQQCDSDPAATADRSDAFEPMMGAFRRGFFEDCRDISRWDVQCDIARKLGADIGAIEARIDSGAAFAGLAADYQDAERMRIEGSPSLVLNEGRQKLYGNVGFRLIEANVQALIHAPAADDASWC